MKILRIRKSKAYSTFYFEAEDWEIDLIRLAGINRFIKESGIAGVIALPVSGMLVKQLKKCKKHDLTDQESQYLLNIGFSSILCDGLKIAFPSLDTFDKFPMPRKRKSK